MEIFEAVLLSATDQKGSVVPGRRNSIVNAESRRGSCCIRRKSSTGFPQFSECGPAPETVFDVNNANSNSDLCTLFNKLNCLWNDDDPCDMTIIVGNQEICAHREVLIAYSEYFRAMFLGGLAEAGESSVMLHDVDAQAVESIINFAYSGRLTINVDSVQFLLQAASLLNVQSILDKCCTFLYSQLNANNCMEISTFADSYFCDDLAKSALKYAKLNWTAVIECEEFLEFSFDQLLSLLEGDYLYAPNEMQIYKAARSWLAADITGRIEQFPVLLKCIRFCQLSNVEFRNSIAQDVDLLANATCAQIIGQVEELFKDLSSHKNLSGYSDKWREHRMHLRKTLVTVSGLTPSGERQGDMEAYNPASNSWMLLPPMPVKRSAAALIVKENVLYVTGGTDGQTVVDTVQRFCPLQNSWESDLPRMLSTRSYHNAACYNEDIFLIGGWNKNYTVLDTVEVSTVNDGWQFAVPPLCIKRRGMGAAFFAGLLYVCGGHDGLMTLNSVERFDFNTNKWSAGPSMGQARSDLGCCELNGYLYAIGGSRKDSSCCERFSPVSGWEPIAAMTRPRPHGPVGVQVLDGCIYALGGSDRNTGNILEKFDPLSNCWTICASMKNSRCDTGLVILKIDPLRYRCADTEEENSFKL